MNTAMDKVVRIQCTVKAVSSAHAENIFQLASSRLLHVHDWSRLRDCLLTTSEHRDHNGAQVSRSVVPQDYFNVTNGDTRPFTWMRVEFVVDRTTANGGEVAVLARQVELPFHDAGKSDDDVKPAIIRVVRRGLEITASFVTEARPFSAVFNRVGVYAVQWRSLMNALLSDLDPRADRHGRRNRKIGPSIVR